ncbi:MAG: hypothetical protein K1X67_11855 [Fimbriimonadaceae bacterium]|nr:hypothetical protein [Fimbriimonadaceae bacterium]
MKRLRLDDLWTQHCQIETVDPSGLPEPVRRYVAHACPTPILKVGAVRLRMTGEMKLKTWCPFTAEQVIHAKRGMIWEARTKMAGLPVSGFDRIVDDEGAMCWKILGLVPIIRAEGKDVTRSAAGRMFGELTWLPSALLETGVTWQALAEDRIRAVSKVAGIDVALDLEIDPAGRVLSASSDRWGNPDGAYSMGRFGVIVEDEATFGGFTIPSKIRAGWRYGSEAFESQGVFFKANILEAEFR